MTIAERKYFYEGKDLYAYYVSLSGEATLRPKSAILRKMSRLLDLSLGHIEKCINTYLWN